MTFKQDAASAAHNRPIEFFDLALSTGTTYRIAAGNRDLMVGSFLYKAEPATRTDLIAPKIDGGSSDVTLSIRVDHPLVRRWLQQGSPPRQTVITCYQKQERSGEIEQQWTGLVTGISIDDTESGPIAKLAIPSRIVSNVARFLPTVTTGLTCPYILYDQMCQVDRASFVVSTTAISVDGRDVRVDMGDLAKIGLTPGWSALSELVHVPTGERMTIQAQVDDAPGSSTLTTITMQLPLPDLKAGDAVQVYAGCAHDVGTCKAKFDNVARFGGDPYAPLTNPFVPGGSGLKTDNS